jgi:hypothetical protein
MCGTALGSLIFAERIAVTLVQQFLLAHVAISRLHFAVSLCAEGAWEGFHFL